MAYETEPHEPPHGKDGAPDGPAIPRPAHPRPSLPHRIDSSASSSSAAALGHPLSPPLPPACFNPPPDIHPLIRAATARTESAWEAGDDDHGLGSMTPLAELDRLVPSGGLATTTTPAPAPAPASPNEVGILQRRLSEKRQRRQLSGLHGVEDQGRMPPEDVTEPSAGHGERGTGTGHLRGAREELQAVLEETIAQMPMPTSTPPCPRADPSVIPDPPAIVDSVHPSPLLSPALSPAPATSACHAPTSFEDVVRHRRHGSVGQSPTPNLTGSGPRRTSVTKGSSPCESPAGEPGKERTAMAPASILQFPPRVDDPSRRPPETSLEPVESALGDLDIHTSGHDSERADPGAHLDATLLDSGTALDPVPAAQQIPPSSSPCLDSHIADTHLWDSVWPSSTSPTTHLIESPRAAVSYPKPMSDPRRALRPRLPMHSRTSSMSIHSFSESSVSTASSPPTPSSSSYASPPHTLGPMHHTLSFSRPLSRPHEPASPAAAAQQHPRTGIPLFFSEALTAPPAWAHHPSARRGSLASLGTWPLKRDNSFGVGSVVGEASTADKPHTIQEENGADGKGQAATTSAGTGGGRQQDR